MRNRKKYRCTINQDFQGVIESCAGNDGRIMEECAWLGPEMIEVWMELNRLGYAKSVEVWEGDRLVGGLYGFVCGGCFLGESMFSEVSGASKLALIHLAGHMEKEGGIFIDCQLETPHLKSMGARYISYDEFLKQTHHSKAIRWE